MSFNTAALIAACIAAMTMRDASATTTTATTTIAPPFSFKSYCCRSKRFGPRADADAARTAFVFGGDGRSRVASSSAAMAAVASSSSSSAAAAAAAPSPSGVNPRDATVAVVAGMPPPLPPLRNIYYLLRHGQSTANVDGIISSSRDLAGSDRHGLTMLGLEQGRDAAAQLLDLIANDTAGASSSSSVYFYSSRFARAIETARACLGEMTKSDDGDGGGTSRRAREAGLAMCEGVTVHDGLMERYFGRLDGMALSTYAYVWPVDMFDPTHTAFDVESVAAVSARLRATLLDIDSRHGGGGITSFSPPTRTSSRSCRCTPRDSRTSASSPGTASGTARSGRWGGGWGACRRRCPSNHRGGGSRG